MQKLVTKNPVLRFKQGRKIVKGLYGFFTSLIGSIASKIPEMLRSEMLKRQNSGPVFYLTVDNKTGEIIELGYQYGNGMKIPNEKISKLPSKPTTKKSTITKKSSRSSNKVSTPVTPQATETIDLKPIEPVSVITSNVGNTITRQGYSFTLPKPEVTQTTELPMLTPPEARDYNRDNVRAMRGTYSNVDLYFDYLRNNPNSNEARLWDNMWYGVNDWNKRRLIFNETMNLHGISGNLGRRDSGRLANLHNLLRRITIPGSESEIGFRNGLSAYDTVPELPNYSDYINWRDALNLTHTNTPFITYAKQGSKLVSRNPVKKFKIKKGLLGLSFLIPRKNKTVEYSKDSAGNNVVTTTIDRGIKSFKNFRNNKLGSYIWTKKNPEYNDTVYTYIPQQYISLNPKYETSNNWATAGVSLRRPLFERLRNIFNNLSGTPRFKNFRKVAQ